MNSYLLLSQRKDRNNSHLYDIMISRVSLYSKYFLNLFNEIYLFVGDHEMAIR